MELKQCHCDEDEMCGPCLMKMEADMLRLRERPTPDSGSLEDAVSWQLARSLETPTERFLRDEALYRGFEGGLN